MINQELKLLQKQDLPDKKTIDSYSHLLVLGVADSKKIRMSYVDRLFSRRRELRKKKTDTSPLELDLPNKSATHVIFACLTGSESTFDLLTLARKMLALQKDRNCSRMGVIIAGFSLVEAERIAESIVAAAAAATAEMPSYKSRENRRKKLRRLDLYGINIAHGFKRTLAEAQGNSLARYLSMLPPNELTPGEYTKRVQRLARDEGWKFDFLDLASLNKKNAGAFLAVVQGSDEQDAGIVRLRYRPVKKSSSRKVMLLGKGICYDTGGTNLKPANFMYGMHKDMQGSAVALGAFLALSRLQVDMELECWLALAMNHIGPQAYKPNDVVTAANGTSIEVVHTDAEGRMVLADTLALASREGADLIMDFATLTGACVYAIGTGYSGVFSNRESCHPVLIEAGKHSGERVWPFPLDEDYDRLLESEIADVKQCSREGGVDHILAARFLQRFVEKNLPWIHMDLSSSSNKGGLAHIPTETTGFGVRYTVELLLDERIFDRG